MKKVILITLVILISVWSIGLYRINLSQNGLIDSEISIEPEEPLTTNPTTSTAPIVSPSRATSSITKTTSQKNRSSVPAVKTPEPTAIIPTTVVPEKPEPLPNFEVINTFARKSIVNIFCTVRNNELSPISGTGVIINSEGLVLTNAHVAQYFLLKDLYIKDYITCVLRTGSPAYPKYNVELVYISPAWVKQNADMLKVEKPKGTGENDFAFLRITGAIDGSTIPTLPYLTPNAREIINIDEPVILVSYPAGFLGGLSIIKDLNLTSGITAVRDYFTFKENTIDIISVPGTIVSQKGSSGGAVVDKNSTLLGIITTSSGEVTTGERDLSAITLGYINRSLKNEVGINLYNFLSGDVVLFAKNFQTNEAPTLTKILTDTLTKTN